MLASVLLSLFLFVTANVADESNSPCPAGWNLNEESKTCIKAVNDVKISWKKAREFCQSNDGDLVVIKNSHINDFVQGLLSLKRYWIGSKYNSTTKMMRYLDGEEVTPSYEAWAPRQPNNYRGKQECIEIIRTRGGLWNDRPCKRRNHFVCEKPTMEKKENGPIANKSPVRSCDQGWMLYEEDQTCLKLFLDSVPFGSAFGICMNSHNGSLVIIPDEKKNLFIRDMLHETIFELKGVEFWIYLHKDIKQRDGKPLFYFPGHGYLGDYHPWAPNHPSDAETGKDCTVEYADIQTTNWRDVSCGNYHSYYMCQKPAV